MDINGVLEDFDIGDQDAAGTATERTFGRCFNTHVGNVIKRYHASTWAGMHLLHGMNYLNNQASVIRCNFNIGPPWDVDKIVE